jgi:hypothetical protein
MEWVLLATRCPVAKYSQCQTAPSCWLNLAVLVRRVLQNHHLSSMADGNAPRHWNQGSFGGGVKIGNWNEDKYLKEASARNSLVVC